MNHTIRTALAATIAAGAVTTALATPGAQADPGKHDRATSQGTVADIRKAIAGFRDVKAAEAAGYVQASGCETSPAGSMGFHFFNPAYAGLADPSEPIDPAHPTVLLYGPDGNGGLQLLGAEFFRAYVGQEAPTLAGEKFDGPMAGHGPGMPWHYDLHVWTEVANPAGVFAQWNPKVEC